MWIDTEKKWTDTIKGDDRSTLSASDLVELSNKKNSEFRLKMLLTLLRGFILHLAMTLANCPIMLNEK